MCLFDLKHIATIEQQGSWYKRFICPQCGQNMHLEVFDGWEQIVTLPLRRSNDGVEIGNLSLKKITLSHILMTV